MFRKNWRFCTIFFISFSFFKQAANVKSNLNPIRETFRHTPPPPFLKNQARPCRNNYY